MPIPVHVPGDPYNKEHAPQEDGHGLPDQNVKEAERPGVVSQNVIENHNAKDVDDINEQDAVDQTLEFPFQVHPGGTNSRDETQIVRSCPQLPIMPAQAGIQRVGASSCIAAAAGTAIQDSRIMNRSVQVRLMRRDKGDELMKWGKIIYILAWVFTLLLSGRSVMNTYQSPTPGGPNMFGCEGDKPSPFPPYCHPGH